MWRTGRWYNLLPPGVQECATHMWPCAAVHGPQVIVGGCVQPALSHVCAHTCAHTQVAGHVSGSPPACVPAGLHPSGQQMQGGGESLSSHIQATP